MQACNQIRLGKDIKGTYAWAKEMEIRLEIMAEYGMTKKILMECAASMKTGPYHMGQVPDKFYKQIVENRVRHLVGTDLKNFHFTLFIHFLQNMAATEEAREEAGQSREIPVYVLIQKDTILGTKIERMEDPLDEEVLRNFFRQSEYRFAEEYTIIPDVIAKCFEVKNSTVKLSDWGIWLKDYVLSLPVF